MTVHERKIPVDCTLQSERLTLRPAGEPDFPVLCDILSDPVTMHHLKFMAHLDSGGWTSDQVRERFEERKKLQEAEQAIQFVITENISDALIGTCSFPKIDLENKNAEFGIIIYHPYWHKAIAAECHLMCLSYAFEELGLHRVEFRTIPENAPMRSFFQKNGISFEHVRKDAICNGKVFLDEVVYAVLKLQWSEVKGCLIKRICHHKDHHKNC